MRCYECGRVSGFECIYCKKTQQKFDLEFKAKEKLRWKRIEESKNLRRQMTKNEAAARERQRKEDRLEVEAERKRKQVELRDFTAKSEMEFRLGVEKMFQDCGYEADSGTNFKKGRSQRFYERRRRVVFTADELTVYDKQVAKMKVNCNLFILLLYDYFLRNLKKS